MLEQFLLVFPICACKFFWEALLYILSKNKSLSCFGKWAKWRGVKVRWPPLSLRSEVQLVRKKKTTLCCFTLLIARLKYQKQSKNKVKHYLPSALPPPPQLKWMPSLEQVSGLLIKPCHTNKAVLRTQCKDRRKDSCLTGANLKITAVVSVDESHTCTIAGGLCIHSENPPEKCIKSKSCLLALHLIFHLIIPITKHCCFSINVSFFLPETRVEFSLFPHFPTIYAIASEPRDTVDI